MSNKENNDFAIWFARTAVGLVFLINISCAISFILWPERYAPGFEISGVPGEMIVQGFGILFLMWNATYPPVVFQPTRHQTLFAVILVQQLIGVLGEAWLWTNLPAGHTALLQTGLRFIVFDGLGLLIIGVAYLLLFARRTAETQTGDISKNANQ